MRVEAMTRDLSKIAEKDQEQAYFDAAKEHREASAASWAPSNFSGGTPAERRAMQLEANRRTIVAPDEPAAFGRIDADGEDPLYIGKVRILNEQKDLLVTNWQSKAAERYSQATLTETPINIGIKDSAPADYMERIGQQIGDGELRLGEITEVHELKENLDANAVPDSIYTTTAESYGDFLTERRLLMSHFIRDYYRSL